MPNTILTVKDIRITKKQEVIGIIFALITVLIWSSYALSLRVAALSPLTLIELTFFRYAIPGFLLLPIFIKSFKEYRKVPPLYIFGIVFGSGVLFFLFSGLGMQLTKVAYGSTLIPGTIPLFVTLLAVIVYKQAFPSSRKIGISTICFGVIVMLIHAGSSFDVNLLIGQGLFLLSALMWSFFTIGIRQSGLSPLKVAALAAVPNGFFILLWIIVTMPELAYMQLSFYSLIAQAFVQGIIIGIFSGICFSAAIVRLGAEKTSAIGALTPACATFLATIFLGEEMDINLLLGMTLVIVGVFLASGVLKSQRE
ncbi:MAG: DMT family transporter [Arcobacter sp.]|nr:DMT family transporter [Arcobacter sp.]